MKTQFTILIFLFFFGTAIAQDFSITNHNFDNFHSFPSQIYFAKDNSGDIWVLQNGGFDGNIISRYSDGVWESIDFSDCGNCVYNMKANNDGIIYVSSGMGFYAWENNTWVSKSGDVTARQDFTFDSQNRLWFEHDDGSIKRLAFLNLDSSIEFIDGVEGEVSDLSFGTDNLIWFQNQNQITSTDGSNITDYGFSGAQMETGKNNSTYFTDFDGDIGSIVNGFVSENQFPSADNGFQTTAMTVDTRYNTMWLGNQGVQAGITYLDLSTGDTEFLNSDDLYVDVVGLTDAMFVTNEGTLWAAGRFDGQVVEITVDYMSATDDLTKELNVFPNPVIDKFTIISDNVISKKSKLRILDQLGNEMKQVHASQSHGQITVDLSALGTGIYFIQMEDSATFRKIVKL